MYRLSPNQLQVIVMDHIDDLRPNSGGASRGELASRFFLLLVIEKITMYIFQESHVREFSILVYSKERKIKKII
jgi:hypothetical protein